MSEAVHPAQLLFTEKHPLTASLDMTFHPESVDVLRVEVEAPKSFAKKDCDTVHTGFHTLLLDTVLGSCAIGKLKTIQPIATIKLSCNHIREVEVGTSLECIATFSAEENSIIYISGDIKRKSDGAIISSALGSFMVGTTSRPLSEKQS